MDDDFDSLAIEIFQHQAKQVDVYRDYIQLIGVNPNSVSCLQDIPYLPISFYKSHQVKWRDASCQKIFRSSGTTSTLQKDRSKLYLANAEAYHTSFTLAFEKVFPGIKQYEIFAVLPSYQERDDASLVYMVNELMLASSGKANFFLNDWEAMLSAMQKSLDNQKQLILFAVSFVLIEFVRAGKIFPYPISLIDTGGMKGRGKEMIKSEFYEFVKPAFPQAKFYSEYGMTELLSQAYSKDKDSYFPPQWMKALVRDPLSPFDVSIEGSGALNVIDLAAIEQCSFIATDDLGRVLPTGEFEVLGRIDHSDLRGCSQLVI